MAGTDEIAGVFDRAADVYDTVIPFFRTFGELLVDVAGIAREERVLDVAAGRGASALPAAERASEVVAVDLAPTMVERLRAEAEARGVGNLSAQVADAQDLPFEAEFDVALCGFFLHILPDPDPALSCLFRALRPGGRCVVSNPMGGGPQWSFYGAILGRHAAKADPPLQPPPAARDLESAMRDAGFDDVVARDEVRRFVFDSAEDWWTWVWSQGQRAPLERFPDDALAEVKRDMLDAVAQLTTSEGIVLEQSARFVSGRKGRA